MCNQKSDFVPFLSLFPMTRRFESIGQVHESRPASKMYPSSATSPSHNERTISRGKRRSHSAIAKEMVLKAGQLEAMQTESRFGII
ncbi:uncharacterized protein Aud_006607 [Aspergillus udagawae]|uniref:Uncharacterized protein n=1 Tax=Aspergillus udagawae TaxID=91492 RepID=A0A8E0V1N7_9EURO|nr:uncharacterized protein Aud_006607 [Aspergillus udagawae]GIC90175.1 hypothetical protein Aud_006607 [Aspergillus udagawae]